MEGKLNTTAVGYQNLKLEETSLHCREETGKKESKKTRVRADCKVKNRVRRRGGGVGWGEA